ncbi:MAG: gliding motility protein GldM [Flavobacteriales bacterium]|jgi:gliding motility-associated protein GldM|nr:gliding motility protein GldM [Flavobacteriales bacterium]
MSGGKETARQKMVGLMYLVLMALLAMNVSKDILEAFVTVNHGLQNTAENYEKKNEEVYAAFDKAKSINPQKVTEYWNKAQEAKRLSVELTQYINSVQNTVVSKTEQITEDQADTLQLKHAEKKDDYDTPTNILIGDSHDGSAGLSANLRTQIEQFKTSLLDLLRAEDRDESKLGLNTNEVVVHNGIDHNWEMNNFYHTPLAATVTILSQIQNEVKNAEYYVISKLMEEFGHEDIPFDTVAAKVIATSNYVLQGEDYQAQLFLAAYSKTQQPNIYIGEYDSVGNLIGSIKDTISVVNGIGNYSIPTDTEGVFEYSGAIQMTTPNGDVRSFPFQTDYIVAKPNLVVSPTKMLVFYKGPKNPVEISVPGVASENIEVRITGGNSIQKIGSGNYEVEIRNGSPRQVFINVKARMPDGSIKDMGREEFVAKNMPKPYASIGGIVGAGKMSINTIKIQAGVKAEYDPEFVFDLPVRVTSFTVEYQSRNGMWLTLNVENSYKFDSVLKTQIFPSLKGGQKVMFKNIKGKNSAGQKYDLDPVIIEII